ncbi:MAG: 16S rRNA processing protein RimM [Clostridiales bacterium]|nr:16S rRNA processing protein RimM [Clostridiales bacterium]
MENYLRVGVITSTHGIKGEVKVYPTTEDPQRFRQLEQVILDTGKELIPLDIEEVKFFKQMVILKFKGIDNINDVQKYRNMDLLVTRENAIKLEEGEYFICDLINCEVFTESGERLGILTEVMTNAANDVYVVQMDNGKEVLLPAINDCILNIDVENKKVIVHLMKGLL